MKLNLPCSYLQHSRYKNIRNQLVEFVEESAEIFTDDMTDEEIKEAKEAKENETKKKKKKI